MREDVLNVANVYFKFYFEDIEASSTVLCGL